MGLSYNEFREIVISGDTYMFILEGYKYQHKMRETLFGVEYWLQKFEDINMLKKSREEENLAIVDEYASNSLGDLMREQSYDMVKKMQLGIISEKELVAEHKETLEKLKIHFENERKKVKEAFKPHTYDKERYKKLCKMHIREESSKVGAMP